MPQEIDVPTSNAEQLRGVLSAERFGEFQRGVEQARKLLAGRTLPYPLNTKQCFTPAS